MAKVKDSNFLTLEGWMVATLDLKGDVLIAYGLIFQFTQEGAGIFTGGLSYIASWAGCSIDTARRAVKLLVAKGLIFEHRGKNNGVPYCNYTANIQYLQNLGISLQNASTTTPQNAEGDTCKMQGKTINSKPKEYNPNLPPTPQEVADYCRSRGFADPEGFADMFVELCTNAGWRRANGKGDPITNWKNYIVSSWERNHKNKSYPRAVTTPNQQVNRNSLNSILR